MTKTLTTPQRLLVSTLMTGLLALSLLLALMPTPARAASLTEPQIQAVLNLLVSFNVDQGTVSNVDAILHNKPTPAAAAGVTTSPVVTTSTASTTASTAPTTAIAPPVCVLVANKSTAIPGDQIILTWKSTGATYSSSPNGNTGANGVVTVTPTATTIYQKTVFGPGGSAKCQMMVTVAPLQTTAPASPSAPTPTSAINTQMVMAQPEINLASVATAAAQLPFALAIDSLTNIFVELGIGR